MASKKTLPKLKTDPKIKYKPPGCIDATRLGIQKKHMKDTPYILVAAIDFGTTFSGYAFSTQYEYKRSPLKVSNMNWTAASGNLLSLKTSTCILFKPDGSFHSFGFDAEDKYADLLDQQKHQSWYFFRRFKMSLYEQDITRTMKISDQNGRDMLAMNVFSSSIRFLKEHLLAKCQERGTEVLMSDIRWVLTMPAIWSDKAKQFMRECAEKAGIPGPQLVMSLEAEAAALYCKYLPVSDMTVGKAGNISIFKPGAKYMVLDVGGGTVDITVHQVEDGLQLKEIHMANGGDWGGTMVDTEFEKLLVNLLGHDVFEKFKRENVSDLLELQRSFETKKRCIHSSSDSKITFTLPCSLLDIFEEINPGKSVEDRVATSKDYANNLTWKSDKLRIKSDIAKTLFEPSVRKIIDHVKELLQKPEVADIDAIILVGGFAECPILHNELSTTFQNKRLVIPNQAGLAVLIGAVINGHELEAVTERISRLTYGVGASVPFVLGLHDPRLMVLGEDGMPLCANAFCTHVRVGNAVPVGLRGESQRYKVVSRDQKTLPVRLFTTKDTNPMYVLEEGVESIGELIVEMPDTTRGLDRGVDVVLTFGGAEIEVAAFDMHTQKETNAYFNFLG
ncbi:heat shock 70 kDa protein 12A-like [Mizuhopecten yessoensis]|uniref:Heat shock 70 kDa protein n=1 Tax=Mizuhopecten yessoensis TaxID=6573 RepID=A0A1C9U2Y1_MIZYE|nr:heat shock 70 kDa protein 12A-like [Mizuhopecten yessoensis]XP_021349342.1 heat shock 70 kDa protein 12A-like [Mizuhopecten yessoensis]XP_021349343.1 heat shock 70 kDa protein 12A-like [Mizuhopecten yessoensis]XP_021349344.1 heat shock 70 kDa protein 12A-like [Mizuhopecten yessoensis]AOR17344.1 heat shock 70 kDa protein [Mizuhopecten yessoensis]OWF52450.1 Heat shock 70 kDa protein 12A [Mizuhopecten yessoensis]